MGISGGKDSLTLLYALAGLKRFYPHPFELEAITVDLGHPGFDVTPVRKLCESMEIPYTVVKTEIAQIIFEERKESNPCSLCAKMRKGALNDAIKKAGCNKVAYAHHKGMEPSFKNQGEQHGLDHIVTDSTSDSLIDDSTDSSTSDSGTDTDTDTSLTSGTDTGSDTTGTDTGSTDTTE